MAKRAKPPAATDGGEPTGVEAIRGNGYDKTMVESFVSRIENLNADKRSRHSEYMLDCKQINEDIGEVLDEAKDKGIPKKEMKKVIKARALARQIEEIRDDLEGDQQDNFDLLIDALGGLGELPLGKAALAAAAPAGSEQPTAH